MNERGHEFTVREAHAADYDAVCASLDEVDRLHREQLPWLFRAPLGAPRSRELFEGWLNDPDWVAFVAEADGLVGVAIGQLRSFADTGLFVPQRYGVIDGIGVTAAWRRRGVATALAHAVERWAHDLDAQWVELGVYDFNQDARRFYERMGYLPLLTKLRKPR